MSLRSLDLVGIGDDDVVVESLWSGVSTGTEKLFYNGTMPVFPGMQYPLVPGYETVGRVVDAGHDARDAIGTTVFVPGANCYREVAGLFGATASRLVLPSQRVIPVPEFLGETGILLSLAATAFHAIAVCGDRPPEVVIGHGIVGRLVARVMLALGHPAPEVWETNPARRDGALGYQVLAGPENPAERFASVLDASGDAGVLDSVIPQLAPSGLIVLAGFYGERVSFPFVPAFMREAQFRIAAEFKPEDVQSVLALVRDGLLSLDGLITNLVAARDAAAAYSAAFSDPSCVKMAIDWRAIQ